MEVMDSDSLLSYVFRLSAAVLEDAATNALFSILVRSGNWTRMVL